jgi:hypothetical protein
VKLTLARCLLGSILAGCTASRSLRPPDISLHCDPAIAIGNVDAKYVEVTSTSWPQGVYLDYRASLVSGGRVDDLPLAAAIAAAGSADHLLSRLSPDRLPSTSHAVGGDTAMGVAVTAFTLGIGAPALLIPIADSFRLRYKKLAESNISSPMASDGHGYLFFTRAAYSKLEVTASTCSPTGLRHKQLTECSSATTTAECTW